MSTAELEPVTKTPDLAMMPRADSAAIWAELRSRAEGLKRTAETLVVTDVTDIANQKLARATRLSLREIRLTVEKRRVELVEGMTQETRRINSNAKEVKDFCEGLESRLLEQEQFIELETERQNNERRAARAAELAPYMTSPVAVDLALMAPDVYASFLADQKELHALRVQREKAEQEAREAAAKAEREEQERIRAENERLRREAVAREEQARREREEAAIIQRQQEERAAAERAEALRFQCEAEARATQERAAAGAAIRAEREQREAAERREREVTAAAEARGLEARREAQRIEQEAIAREEKRERERRETEERARLIEERRAEEAKAKAAVRAAFQGNLAAVIYTAYCAAVGGKAFNGDPLPSWEVFSADPNKTLQANGWRAAAQAADDFMVPY